MIRLIVRFANWLNSRFPETLEVKRTDYELLCADLAALDTQVDILRDEVRAVGLSHNATVDRVARIEASAVHKGAVQDLVTVIKAVQTDVVALKANLGWQKPILDEADALATLNGDPI